MNKQEANGNQPEVNGNQQEVNGNQPEVNGNQPEVNKNQQEQGVKPENNTNKISMNSSFTPLIKKTNSLNKPEIMQQGGSIYDFKEEILKIIS